MQFEVDFDEWSQFSREMREELCTALTLDVKSFVSPFYVIDFFESYICQNRLAWSWSIPKFFGRMLIIDNILTPKDDLAIKSSLKRPFSEFQEFGGWNLAKYKLDGMDGKGPNEAIGLKDETQHISSSWWRLFGDVSMTRAFIVSVVKMM